MKNLVNLIQYSCLVMIAYGSLYGSLTTTIDRLSLLTITLVLAGATLASKHIE